MFYTNIEQSKKLLELGLSLESADMIFDGVGYELGIPKVKPGGYVKSPNTLPCWSVGALLEVMPKKMEEIKGHTVELIIGKPKKLWSIVYFDWTGLQHGHEAIGDTLTEAAYNMVVWLLENGYIKKGE